MQSHLQVQTTIQKDPQLQIFPTIFIEHISTAVSLDDRLDADIAFDRPFAEALRDGMAWYLSQRGLRVVESNPDISVTGVITSYEGSMGWGDWGADIELTIRISRRNTPAIERRLHSLISYEDDDDVVDSVKAKYKPLHRRVQFDEILFTRLGADLSEKVLSAIREVAEQGPLNAAKEAYSPTSTGTLTVDSTVANAEVSIDGDLVGTTRLENLLLPAKKHLIEVRKAGYKAWRREIMVLSGANSRVVAELEVGTNP